MKFLNVPNMLTFSRLVLSPLVLPILLVYLLPFNILWINILLGIIFIGLSFTDFFDGYLARKLNQETKLGKLLDPIADKFLSYSTLIALLAVNKIYFYWVIILIGRSIFMMGLRLISMENKFPLPVSYWGKINTMIQLVYLAVVIINPYQSLGLKNLFNQTELALLVIVLVLSIFSAKKYLDIFIKQYLMRSIQQEKEEESEV